MSVKTVSSTAILGGAVVAGALVAGTLVAPIGASAASSCTAWASMPSHVSLGKNPVTIRLTLRGTAGCDAGGVDNGGTATLRGPGARDAQRWAHLGSKDTQTFQLRVDKLGTYTAQNSDIQIYDRHERLVPVQWRRTSVVVSRGHH